MAVSPIRVSQAGRQLVGETDPNVRVTQAGRQVLEQFGNEMRVTQAGRQILFAPPYPTDPSLLSPYEDEIVRGTTLPITYTESIDPLGVGVTYFCRYKLQADTVWTWAFQDRVGFDTYYEDIDGVTDGDYEIELWSENAEYSSAVQTADFTIHQGAPTAPTITAPYEGQQWTKTTNTVEWDAATDPDEDSLTYDARYKLVSAGSWTSLFTGETDLYYDWNQAAFSAGDYELEIWANDGVGDGPSDHVYFSIVILNQPDAPRIRIVGVGQDYVTAELEEYNHPFSVAWKTTRWELIPFGGSWSNPVVQYDATDSAEQLEYTFEGLPVGFRGVIRATFQDTSNSWGDPSGEAFFVLPATTSDWERRWERNADWTIWGLGIEGRKGDWGTGWHEQPISAMVDPNAEAMGSFYLSGRVMAGGCYCGWIGRDTEFRRLGIGVFKGDSENGGQYSVFFGMEFQSTYGGITGGHWVNPFMYTNYEDCAGSYGQYGEAFIGYTQVSAGAQPAYGQPIGPWLSGFTHYPVYFLELWVQRNVATNQTRIRGRINYEGWASSNFPFSSVNRKQTSGDQWDIDVTVPCVTPCGLPGFYQGQLVYAFSSAYGQYFDLQYTALRDEGREYVQNVAPLTPYEEPEPGVCTDVSEDALEDPVFFPAPPNGDVEEDWVHPSDLITARDDTEQRISLRDIPMERVSFTATLLTSREVSQLKSLIWMDQPSRWGVPMWMDAARLDVDLSSGSGTIPAASVDTEGRRFEDATHVAIWKDQFTWDFLPATLNPDGSITLTGTTSRAYSAFETYVIPCRIGRMKQTAEFTRSSPRIGDFDVTFILEAVDG